MCRPNFIIFSSKILLVFSVYLILVPYTNQDEVCDQELDYCHAPSMTDTPLDDTHRRIRRDLTNNKSDEFEFWKIYSRFHGVQKAFFIETSKRQKNVYWKRIFRGSHWRGPLYLQYFEVLRRVSHWFNEYENVTNSRLPFEIEDLETVHHKAKAVLDLRQHHLHLYPVNSTAEYNHRKVVVLWNQIVHSVKRVLDRQKALMQGIVLE